MTKRLFDLLASGIGLLFLCPFFLIIALAIKLESPGQVFFRQERVGRFGKTFRIHKFRTMVTDAERRGLQITVGSDARVTRVGALLRKTKLDELAQLLDVFIGRMSLVGPRPEVPRYVAHYPDKARSIVQSVKPGITDWASIKFKDENEILGRSSDPHLAYINEVLPIKIAYYTEYAQGHSFLGDLHIIFATLGALIPVLRFNFAKWRWAFWMCVVAVLVLALIPPVPNMPTTGWDKSNHLLAFTVLTLLVRWAYPSRKLPMLLLMLLAFGGVIEVLQALTPIRFAEWADWLADCLGVLLGWGVLTLLKQLTRSPEQS
jgi:lipopolysaccharide/colanic/teichoic acid biosynthesis glycosyltransferase/VanZ family protein